MAGWGRSPSGPLRRIVEFMDSVGPPSPGAGPGGPSLPPSGSQRPVRLARTDHLQLLRGVHLVVPAGLPPTSGNWITAERWAARLRAMGITVSVHDAAQLGETPAPGRGEVVHALHALRAGLPALRWAGPRPVLWTFTGTDLDPEALDQVRAAAGAVAALVAFHPEAAAELRRALPAAADRVRVVAPGVPLPRLRTIRPADAAGAAGGEVRFLLPAGLRPVKQPELALEAVRYVRAAGVPARLTVVGPARDEAYAADFLRRLQGVPFARYAGEVPHAEMGRWYVGADVVLNTSRAEGLSNAVLEAMAHGRCILATDIPGNRAAVRHGVDGWLAPPEELPAAALRLARDRELRLHLGAAARRAVAQRFSPRAEAQAYVRLYVAAVLGAGG
jgi:glycosyltransferase involved in cell wall biosynthesis